VGSGSGIFSLAARRLGVQVHSFDYDPEPVGCTLELKRRYFPRDDSWTVEEGSVLGRMYLDSPGRFDVVYLWGVLHHTGKMWDALENVRISLAEGGQLFIAIYNDQGTVPKFLEGCQTPLLLWMNRAYAGLLHDYPILFPADRGRRGRHARESGGVVRAVQEQAW
jgi:SAM-dependent methyltransferase